MYFLSCVEIKTIIIIIIIIIIITRTYDPRKNQDGSNSLKKRGIFVNSASLPLNTACRPQFNLRLKDTSGPNNSLLKLIKNG